jgi:DNA topoisomerase-1
MICDEKKRRLRSTERGPAREFGTQLDPEESASAAGLRYVSDAKPGITRKPWRNAFRYLDSEGKPVRDIPTLARIKSLVIPPGWQSVWICPIANGHLQVTGRDARGRKQSRYHPRWREVRDETKYERMLLFGSVLPRIREQVEQDLALPGLPREKILATIVRLMETTYIRVGNEEYARKNKSFGLTTLRNKHVEVEGSTVKFNFRGKSGVEHAIGVNDRRIGRIIIRCLDLPGYELFQYLEPDGTRHSVDSSDVNEYLRQVTNDHFTAKDFRTWAGTVMACTMLHELDSFTSETQAKKNVVAVVKAVAYRLGNTPSVCRKCYVHPTVIDSYMSGAMLDGIKRQIKKAGSATASALRQEELALVKLLKKRLASKS